MATYLELLTAAQNDALRQKIRVACLVAADTVRAESAATVNHAARLAWAKGVFESPVNEGEKMLWAVLAQNKSASLAAILAASDAVIQTNVDATIDLFAV